MIGFSLTGLIGLVGGDIGNALSAWWSVCRHSAPRGNEVHWRCVRPSVSDDAGGNGGNVTPVWYDNMLSAGCMSAFRFGFCCISDAVRRGSRSSIVLFVCICSIYLPPSMVFNSNDFINLLHQLPPPILITGDFNSHSTLWGSTKFECQWKMLEDILTKHNLRILNNASPTYIYTPS